MKKTLLTAALIAASAPALANWNLGIAYSNYSEDSTGEDLSLATATLSAGYLYHIAGSDFSIMPELRYGYGIVDDEVRIFGTSFDVEIERFVVASVRANYHVNNNLALFLQPAYGNLKVEAKAGGFSESEDDSEFGFGGGVSYAFNKHSSVEFIYENFDDTDVLTAGYRFQF